VQRKKVYRGRENSYLILTAKNDPFSLKIAFLSRMYASRTCFLEIPDEGGHVGFCTDCFQRITILKKGRLIFVEQF
jgi:predicted alpha/beta-fold hydrolase